MYVFVMYTCVEIKGHLPQSLSTLFFEILSLTEPINHQFNYPSWLRDSRNPPFFALEHWVIDITTVSSFYRGARDPNSSPYAFPASTLLTDPSPLPLTWIS